jgi:hypothetical protein
MKPERGVPAPVGRGNKGEAWTVLRKLQPGESVLIPGKTTAHTSRWIWRLRKLWPAKRYASRCEGTGVRVWRLSDEVSADDVFS